MSRYTDGKRTVEITMQVWDGNQWGPTWEYDFFDDGSLPYDAEKDAHVVRDVDYLIEQATDWQMGIGDYKDDYEGEPGHRPEDRGVTVVDLD